MRVALDAYPLLGRRTGVGTYVMRLAEGLLRLPGGPDLVLPTASVRPPVMPPSLARAEHHHVRVPFRLVQSLWDRGGFPPAEWLVGSDLDVFHATNFVAPPLQRTPLVTTVHDLSYLRYPAGVDERVQRYQAWVPETIRRSRFVICDSSATAAEVGDVYGLASDRVIAIPLGVDPSWHTAQVPSSTWLTEHGLPGRYLVAVGASATRKRIDLLLAAVQRARRDDDSVPPLVVVGDAPAEAAHAAAAAGDAVFVGHLEDEVLRAVVAGAAALVFPSAYEGFGLPLLEAMAAGTPVVASDLAVHREVCGDHGTLVDLDAVTTPGDAVARLAAALITASRTPAGPGEVAAARAWAASFTWDHTAAATLAVYEAARA
jgi:glycosyltransferase involved in cell wall biosynthesis